MVLEDFAEVKKGKFSGLKLYDFYKCWLLVYRQKFSPINVNVLGNITIVVIS